MQALSGDRHGLPAWVWLALPALALWPLWLWSLQRMSDGSDDPLGVVALAALLVLLWRERRQLRTPRLAGLIFCLLAGAAAVLSAGQLPMLLRAVLAILALFAALLSLRAPGQPLLAWLGLGLLALPILASLQFFAGYPLRVLTAEASLWILRAAGMQVQRQGSALDVAGRLVMVDAPCSGIQMAWMAYFTACVTAAWLRLDDRRLLRRLPLLGVLVLAGNVVRNSLLVVLETGPLAGSVWLHEGIGLLVFASVCALVLRCVAGAADAPGEIPAPIAAPRTPLLGIQQALLVGAFAVLGSWPLLAPQQAEQPPSQRFVEWPARLDGELLQPLALSAVEQRFAADFPGVIARFQTHSRVVVLREVERPTRKLHPAADCYRGLGYRIDAEQLRQPADGIGLQRCFRASAEDGVLQVCEYIEDAAGQRFSDTSAWYWAALGGRSPGPWRAVTSAAPML